jgi:type I restriction enzyme, S subunit
MSFPKYEVYKDSWVEWLGEVPEHWTIVPMKHLAVLNPKKFDYQGNQNQSCSFVPMEKLEQ